MTKIKRISFVELRNLLDGLGFAAKRTDDAWVFQHTTEGLLVLRQYAPEEAIDEHDIVSTRKFLDFRGLLDANDFDVFLRKASAPA
jgi:hypothetical protein